MAYAPVTPAVTVSAALSRAALVEATAGPEKRALRWRPALERRALPRGGPPTWPG